MALELVPGQEKQEQTNMPDFYISEERDVELPSDNTLVVEVWNAGMDETFDSLIGKTALDLEDRWHSDNWKKFQDKGTVPIENRPLVRNNGTKVLNCGSIEMWVEMVDSVRASDIKPSELKAPPDQEIDIRVVLITCKDIPPQSGDTINIKLNCNLDCKTFLGQSSYYPAHQLTDVHNGSHGDGIFNWRCVFPKINPRCKSCVMRIGVNENGAFNDTAIGDVQLDMLRYVQKVAQLSDTIEIPETELVFTPINKDPDLPEGEVETCGSVKCSMSIMTNMQAGIFPCGNGRDDPNDHPVLITPVEGRGWGDFFAGFAFSLPDFGLMKKLAPLMIVTLFCVILLKQIGLL